MISRQQCVHIFVTISCSIFCSGYVVCLCVCVEPPFFFFRFCKWAFVGGDVGAKPKIILGAPLDARISIRSQTMRIICEWTKILASGFGVKNILLPYGHTRANTHGATHTNRRLLMLLLFNIFFGALRWIIWNPRRPRLLSHHCWCRCRVINKFVFNAVVW